MGKKFFGNKMGPEVSSDMLIMFQILSQSKSHVHFHPSMFFDPSFKDSLKRGKCHLGQKSIWKSKFKILYLYECLYDQDDIWGGRYIGISVSKKKFFLKLLQLLCPIWVIS